MTNNRSDDLWPDVFQQELDASYYPGISSLERRGRAIGEGMYAWDAFYFAQDNPLSIPTNFNQVIEKLRLEAGLADGQPETFHTAGTEWMSA